MWDVFGVETPVNHYTEVIVLEIITQCQCLSKIIQIRKCERASRTLQLVWEAVNARLIGNCCRK